MKGKKLGVPKNLLGVDDDSQRAFDGAAAALKGAGATLVDVVLPAFDEATLRWVPLCGLEAALAHEATFPSRRGEYGPDLANLIDLGRGLSGLELGKLQLARARLKGEIEHLLASVDLLLMPVMGVATPSLAAMKVAGRTPQTTAARLRYTAPFDMSGHPTLTLPGGVTADGVPVGFQIVGHAFDEAGILAAGHAYQQADRLAPEAAAAVACVLNSLVPQDGPPMRYIFRNNLRLKPSILTAFLLTLPRLFHHHRRHVFLERRHCADERQGTGRALSHRCAREHRGRFQSAQVADPLGGGAGRPGSRLLPGRSLPEILLQYPAA